MRKTRIAAAVTAGALLAAVAGTGASAEPPAAADLVAVTLDGGALELSARDGGQDAYAPEDLVFRAAPGAVPAREDAAFLGEPGRPLWAVGPDESALYPALDATAVPEGALADDAVTVRLADVDGSGDMYAYTVEPPGVPTLRLGTAEGAPDSLTLPAGEELGGMVWAFDEPGTYAVTVEATGTLPSGETVAAEGTYTVKTTTAAVTDTVVTVAQEAEESGNRKVFADGHVDMGPRFVEDAWTVQIRDDTVSPPEWRALADTVLHVVDKAKIEVPADDAYAFLGEAGGEVWMLPQAQQSGIVWPGWNTQDESVTAKVSGNVTWELAAVEGPGEFALFLTGSFGNPQVLFDSSESLPQTLDVPVNTHAHGNFAFSKAGVYHLTVTFSASTSDGGSVTDTKVLNVAVGDETDPNGAFGPGDGSGNGDGDGDGSGDGSMPITGSPWFVPVLSVAIALLVAGTVLVVLARRRRRARGAEATG